MTALADATDPRFTDGQRAHLARFEAAEVPAEVVEAGDGPFILCCDVGSDAWPDACPEHGEDNRRPIEDLSAEGHGFVRTATS